MLSPQARIIIGVAFAVGLLAVGAWAVSRWVRQFGVRRSVRRVVLLCAASVFANAFIRLNSRSPGMWVMAGVALIIGAAAGWSIHAEKRRTSEGRCHSCGYDLHGWSGRNCPACGVVRSDAAEAENR